MSIPKARITQYWGDGQESFRLSTLSQFDGEVHALGSTPIPFRLTIGGFIIPMGGKIELEVIYMEG